MGNVTLPTPVFLAGGAICLLGGYIVGAVTGPDTPSRTTATVASFSSSDDRLCLAGESVENADGVDADGQLCGIWRRPTRAVAPKKGEEFRFVTVRSDTEDGERAEQTVIYGNVVD